jgi:hypothetical protein
MSHRFATTLFTLLTLLPLPSEAESYDYRPFLYLDGSLLASHLTAHICNNPEVYAFEKYQHMNPIKSGFQGGNGMQLGSTSDFMGGEDANGMLKSWILHQPDNSVAPLEIAQRAIALQGGNVLNGLRLVYNVVGEDESLPYGKLYRNSEPIFSKLIDITGEQKMARDGFNANRDKTPGKRLSSRGGNASSWVHFFGAAAIAYDEGTKSTWRGKAVGEVFVHIDQTFGYLQHNFADATKRKMTNHEGVLFGAKLAENLANLRAKKSCGEYSAPGQEYLEERPGLFKANYPLEPGEYPPDHISR